MIEVPIVKCLNLSRQKLRVYVYDLGLAEVYNPQGTIDAVRTQLENVFGGHTIFREFSWVLALPWGKDEMKMIDFFGFYQDGWPGKPESRLVVAQNEQISVSGTACEDSHIIIAREAEWRRQRPSLEDYLRNPPPFEYVRTGMLSVGTVVSNPVKF